MKFWITLLKFLFIGALFIVSNYQLNLSDPVHFHTFKELYFNWLDRVYVRGVELTGYVTQSQWLPETNSSRE